jgi:hypothetical protein
LQFYSDGACATQFDDINMDADACCEKNTQIMSRVGDIVGGG